MAQTDLWDAVSLLRNSDWPNIFVTSHIFCGRPSATTPMPNNALSSSGSNLGPSNPALIDTIKGRVQALKAIIKSN